MLNINMKKMSIRQRRKRNRLLFSSSCALARPMSELKNQKEEEGNKIIHVKIKKKYLIALVVIVCCVVVSVLVLLIFTIRKPDVKMTSHSFSYSGFPSTLTVYVTIFNEGYEGYVTVWVEAYQGGIIQKKSQDVWIGSQQGRDLTFEFSRSIITPFDNPYNIGINSHTAFKGINW